MPPLAVAFPMYDRATTAHIYDRLWHHLRPELAQALPDQADALPTPAHPIITATGHDPAPLAAALDRALAQLPLAERGAIGFTRLLPADAAQYFAIPLPPAHPMTHCREVILHEY